MAFLISLRYHLERMYYFLKLKLRMGNYQNYKNTDSENLSDTDAGPKYMVQINDFLIERLVDLPRDIRQSTVNTIMLNAETLPITEEEPNSVAFIVKDEESNDKFMELEYFNDGLEPFYILDINEITSDEYLDYFNSNKIINELEQKRDL
mgnify:FL=1